MRRDGYDLSDSSACKTAALHQAAATTQVSAGNHHPSASCLRRSSSNLPFLFSRHLLLHRSNDFRYAKAQEHSQTQSKPSGP